MVSVILPAAGRGKRMQAGVNKVFLRLMGKPILFHTLRVFAAVPEVQEIIVVTGAEEVEPLRRALQGLGLFREAAKSVKVVAGGSERQYSVWNGLKASSEASDVVLVHDAARPLVSRATIEAVIEAARAHGAAIAAVPEKNTVKVVKDGVVTATPDRSTLWAVQTPQGFSRSLLMAANEKAESDGFLGTDDASLVERYGAKVHVVMDSYQNIKVTTPEDLVVAEAFLRQSGSFTGTVRRAASEVCDFRLVEGRKIIIGGVEIPHALGLLGHSDADVLLHAISDALLGAAALGDIGRHFPDTDPRYEGADSMKLLAEVRHLLEAKGYRIGNVDATIVAQKPKMKDFIPQMNENIAQVLGV